MEKEISLCLYLPKTWDVLTYCLIKNTAFVLNSASQPRGPVVLLQCWTRIVKVNSTGNSSSSLLSVSQSVSHREMTGEQASLYNLRLSRVALRRTAQCVFSPCKCPKCLCLTHKKNEIACPLPRTCHLILAGL